MSRSRPVTEAELRAGERATWGQQPTAEPAQTADRPRMRLIKWKPLIKGSLRGFATVELPIGLTIYDAPVLRGPKGLWATLPSKPQHNRDGRQKIGADGKAAFAPVLEWRSREISDRFSAAVVELIRAAHPDDLDGNSP